MKKKILITEDEKEYIKRLYGILNEQNYGFQPTALAPQNITPPESYKKVVEGKNFGSFEERILFPAGYYSERYMKSENLVKRLQKLLNQVYPSKMSEGPFILNITTESSESKIPNTDNEKGGIKLESGTLARYRNKSINNFITNFVIKNYPDLQPPIFNIQKIENQPLEGKTEWVGSSYLQALVDCKIVNQIGDLVPNPNACTPKVREWVTNLKKNYDNEQYNGVKVELIRKGSETETKTPKPMTYKTTNCARDMKIKVYYAGTYNEHGCNNAVFEVYANNVLLNRDRDNQPFISLNNAGLMDNGGAQIIKEKVYAKDKEGKSYKKNNEWVQETKYSIKSASGTNAKREDTLTITDELFESIPNIQTELVLKFVCRNLSTWIKNPNDLPNFVYTDPNIGALGGRFPYDVSEWKINGNYYGGTQLTWIGEWYHQSGWKNGCHRAVGNIDITNNEGKTITLDLRTPMDKDTETVYPSIDPCSLQYYEKSPTLAKDTSLNQKNTEIKLK